MSVSPPFYALFVVLVFYCVRIRSLSLGKKKETKERGAKKKEAQHTHTHTRAEERREGLSFFLRCFFDFFFSNGFSLASPVGRLTFSVCIFEKKEEKAKENTRFFSAGFIRRIPRTHVCVCVCVCVLVCVCLRVAEDEGETETMMKNKKKKNDRRCP